MINLKHQIESPTQCLEQWMKRNFHQSTLLSKFRTLGKRSITIASRKEERKKKSLISKCSKTQVAFDILKKKKKKQLNLCQ